MFLIPKPPNVLRLPVARLWNGLACPDKRLHCVFELQKRDNGVLIRVTLPRLPGARVPQAPEGARVDGLGDYDTAEMFFTDEDGQYLEVELGVSGHYLVLGFDGVKNRVTGFEGMDFLRKFERQADGTAVATILIPFDMFPVHLKSLNAFFVAGGQRLAAFPLSGDAPDFHQPNQFPFARLEEDAAA